MGSGVSEYRHASVLIAHLEQPSNAAEPSQVINDLVGLVRAFGGTVEIRGTILCATFGISEPLPDDAERAVSAALEMQSMVADLSAPTEVRIAVGEDEESTEPLADRAEAGTVLIAHGIWRCVRDAFDVEPVTPVHVRGRRNPLRAWRVTALRPVLRTPASGRQPEMVGRASELEALRAAVDEVEQTGRGKLIHIIGPAGIGKSRLTLAFSDWLADTKEGVCLLRGRGTGRLRPFGAFADLLFFRFGLDDDMPPAELNDRLTAGLQQCIGWEARHVSHLISPLLGLTPVDSPWNDGLQGDRLQLRDQARDALVSTLRKLCTDNAVVLVLDDMHHADDDSLKLLEHVVECTAELPILLVVTGQASLLERSPAMGNEIRSDQIWLDGLKLHEAAALLSDMRTEPVSQDDLQALHRATDGSPFRLTQPPQRELSEPEIRILEIAAVVGLRFWVELLVYAGVEVTRLTSALNQLQADGLLHPASRSRFPDTTELAFRHELIRETVLEGIAADRRAQLHEMVAEWLIQQTITNPEREAASIAHHLESAERNDEAGEWYARAARTALDRCAPRTAASLYRTSLLLLPDTEELGWLRLDTLEGLATAQGMLGHVTDALDTWAMLAEEARTARNSRAQAFASVELAHAHLELADYQAALVETVRSTTLARMAGENDLAARAFGLRGLVLGRLGRLDDAQEAANTALELGRNEGGRSLVTALRLQADLCERRGRPGEARPLLTEALDATDERDTRTRARILNQLGAISFMLGEASAAEAYYRATLEAASSRSLADVWRAAGTNLAELLVHDQRYSEALDVLEDLLASTPEDWSGRLDAVVQLCAVHLGLGNGHLAAAWGRRALELAREQTDPRILGATWRNLGRVAATFGPVRISGEMQDAEACFEQAVATFQTAGLQLEAEATTQLALQLGDGSGNRVPTRRS